MGTCISDIRACTLRMFVDSQDDDDSKQPPLYIHLDSLQHTARPGRMGEMA